MDGRYTFLSISLNEKYGYTDTNQSAEPSV
jgi:hypothetical protein